MFVKARGKRHLNRFTSNVPSGRDRIPSRILLPAQLVASPLTTKAN